MLSTVTFGGVIHSRVLAPPPPPPRRRCGQTPLQSSEDHQRNHLPEEIPTQSSTLRTRRPLLLLLLLSLPDVALARSPPAAAISLGIPGPKQWLRDQQKKSAKFLLAPIEASRQSLRNAYLLLESIDSGSTVEDPGEVRKLLNSAVRDCVPQDRNSLVTLQAGTGVEVCTFSLVLKNASSLLDDRDPVKLGAESLLGDLIRSFSSVGAVIDNSVFQLASDRQKVKDALLDTISSLDKFEQGVKDCLGV